MISGLDFDALLLHIRRGFKYGPGLHLGDLFVDDAEAAAAETEHGIELMQFMHALFDFLNRNAQLLARGPSAIPFVLGGIRASGGSRKRMVAGSPFRALKMPKKSSR